MNRPRLCCEAAADGSRVLRAAEPLGEYPPTLAHSLRHWAAAAPDRVLAAERDADGWREMTFGQAAHAAESIGQAYLELGLGPRTPVMLLSGNSLDHLLLTLAGHLVGVPVAPISVAYSLRAKGHARLRAIGALIEPGLVYADDGERFAAALAAVADAWGPGVRPIQVVSRNPTAAATTVDTLRRTRVTADVHNAFAALSPDSTAKILFTSGTTGMPKGVVNTHRMLCANQQMLRQVWPFLSGRPPVLTDWLPWSHTFGGNHNLNLALSNGGSVYIDDGSPLPEAFDRSLDALRRVPPTIVVNVPAGYIQLAQRFEADRHLAARVLARADIILYAGADLPTAVRTKLATLAHVATGRDIPLASSWGATETGPAATSTYGGVSEGIGIPLPGVTVKLTPVANRLEIRVRSASVTPAYLGADLADALDEEGFYRSGDAVRLADADDPARGLIIEGRIGEDFKLANGTWVTAGRLKNRLLSATGLLSDAVLVGPDRPYVTAIAWLHVERANELLGTTAADPRELIDNESLRRHLATTLAELNAGSGTSSRIERLALAAEPPDLDADEITDKGQLNQRTITGNRADLVAALYATPPPAGVITEGQPLGR